MWQIFFVILKQILMLFMSQFPPLHSPARVSSMLDMAKIKSQQPQELNVIALNVH